MQGFPQFVIRKPGELGAKRFEQRVLETDRRSCTNTHTRKVFTHAPFPIRSVSLASALTINECTCWPCWPWLLPLHRFGPTVLRWQLRRLANMEMLMPCPYALPRWYLSRCLFPGTHNDTSTTLPRKYAPFYHGSLRLSLMDSYVASELILTRTQIIDDTSTYV